MSHEKGVLPQDVTLGEFGCPLPSQSICYWSNADDWDQQATDEEEVFIERAVLKRQREFRAGRNTARRCIRSLIKQKQMSGTQIEASTQDLFRCIAMGDSREPIWPDDLSGSITHTQFECHDSQSAQEYCAAVVAFKSDILSIGIDIERIEHLSPDSLALIVTANEWRRSKEYCWPTYWPKFLFAAKESLYKCLFPLTGAYVDFLEADLQLRAVQAVPGLYQVIIETLEPAECELPEEHSPNLRGFVFGDRSLVRAAFWISPPGHPA